MRKIFRLVLSNYLICAGLVLPAGNNISGNPEGISTLMEKDICPDSYFLSEPESGVPSQLELRSPDGQIIFSFGIKNGYPSYSVSYKGKMLVEDSRVSLCFKETGEFGRSLSINNPEYQTIDETYELVVGKTRTVCPELLP